MNFIFPYIGNVVIPTDELHHFSAGQAQPPSSFGFVGFSIHPQSTSFMFHHVWMISRNWAPQVSMTKEPKGPVPTKSGSVAYLHYSIRLLNSFESHLFNLLWVCFSMEVCC